MPSYTKEASSINDRVCSLLYHQDGELLSLFCGKSIGMNMLDTHELIGEIVSHSKKAC
uniref:Protein Ycf2 n=1 Tax=Rhizophora mucronata TaxID=61149 RepID=A0A2P2PMA1_RHIMU